MLLHSKKIQLVQREVDSKIYQQTNPSLNPIIRRIYATRNLVADETKHFLQFLVAPSSIKGIDKASQILIDSIINQQKICIVGDYDVDGATSSALMVDSLSKMGAEVHYIIPNRMKHGYGLTQRIVKKVLSEIADCKLIITVDNGISSIEGVEYAQSQGLKVIITDHHLPAQKLPTADAIVNPNLVKNHPLKNLAGVGVCFYLLCYLVSIAKQHKLKSKFLKVESIQPKDYLDLVALGTVADCVSLDYNNRILVLNGLEMMRQKPRAGISAIVKNLKRMKQEELSSTDISFYLAPTLNAAGRLKDMRIGVECLLSKDKDKAQELANQLTSLNIKRKSIQSSMQQSANQLLKNINLAGDYPGYCFYDPNWHEGISGILASKLKDQLLKPVIVFSNAKVKGILKGSARSVDFLNIKDVLENIYIENPNLIMSYGGHAMAAGLKIQKENLVAFSNVFKKTIRKFEKKQKSRDSQSIIYSDGELKTDEITMSLANYLKNAACWGSGLESPLFHGSFFIQGKKIVAQDHLKLRVYLAKEDKIVFPAICFNLADKFNQIGEVGEKITLCYQIEVNKYNDSLQLTVRYLIKDE